MALPNIISAAIIILYFSAGKSKALNTFYLGTSCQYGTTYITVGDIYSGTNSSGILKTHSMNYYSPNSECEVRIGNKYSSEGIIVSIRKFDVAGCSSSLEFEDSSGVKEFFCSYTNDIHETVTFYSFGAMKLTFSIGSTGLQSYYDGFQITFTTYRSIFTDSTYCPYIGFRCDNGRCINEDLKCDGYNHCGDNSDQICGLSNGAIAGIVCGVVALAICISVTVIRRHRKNTVLGATHITPPTGTVYPPPGTIYSLPGDVPPPYWTIQAQDGGHRNPAFN